MTATTLPSVHPVDEKLPVPRLATLGLQHVLVMYAGAIAVPLIVGRALKLSPEQVALLISADLFACGIVTLIQNASLVGTLAEEALEGLWFDQLFLGVGAIALGGEIFSADEAEARLNGRMLRRTAQPIVLADADKFGVPLTYRVARLAAGMQVVTDVSLAADSQGRLGELGCDVTLAGGM